MAAESMIDTDSEAESIHVLRFEDARRIDFFLVKPFKIAVRLAVQMPKSRIADVCNARTVRCPAEDTFVSDRQSIQVHSDQYPELASHYSRKIAEWYAAQRG